MLKKQHPCFNFSNTPVRPDSSGGLEVTKLQPLDSPEVSGQAARGDINVQKNQLTLTENLTSKHSAYVY